MTHTEARSLVLSLPPLYHGGHHVYSAKRCSAEAINEAVKRGVVTDCPPCVQARPLWDIIVPFNDAWGEDCPPERRRDGMAPLLEAILAAGEPPEGSGGWGFLLADLAVRKWAPRAFDAAGLHAEAQRLRERGPITSPEAAVEAEAWATRAGRAGRAIAMVAIAACAAERAERAGRTIAMAAGAGMAAGAWGGASRYAVLDEMIAELVAAIRMETA